MYKIIATENKNSLGELPAFQLKKDRLAAQGHSWADWSGDLKQNRDGVISEEALESLHEVYKMMGLADVDLQMVVLVVLWMIS